MKIVNVQPGYTYQWVVNGMHIGSGTTSNYQVPGNAGSDFNLSIIAESGAANSCPKAITVTSTVSNNAPLNAAITGSNIFCNNVPGGAQLNTTAGGASYVWNNVNNGQSLNTGTINSYGALQSGSYEVVITTNQGCVSVTPTPHKVEMIGSPALTWTGGVLASVVGANEKVNFVVKNVGAPVTQGYTWTSSTGTANAVVSPGATDVAEITFTGSGVVTLTIVGSGFCGNSAPLTVDVTVNAVKPDMPIIVTPPATNVCGGWLFQIEEGTATTPGTIKYYENLYGTKFTITWNEVLEAGNTAGTGPKVVSGANSRYCYVPFALASNSKAVMTATCTSGGVVSDPSAARTVNGGIGAVQTYNLKGEKCFDVKQTQWPGTECGIWAQRTEADFSLLYEYELTGTLLPTNVSMLTWSLDDPNNLVETTDYTTLNKAKLKIKDVRQHPSIKGSATGLSFTINVTFTVNNGGCTATYTKSIVVNIRDCDCCTTVTDVDNFTYSAAQFGDAGCWMTENLATTKSPSNATIGALPYQGNVTNVKPKANGGLGWGRLYGWSQAVNGVSYETLLAGGQSKGKSDVRGICPVGWVVPSEHDWNMLEKEIATNPSAYSTNTTPVTWDRTWETDYNTYRPGSNPEFGWGESMKSSRVVAGLVNANGKSNTDGTGFDALMVKYAATDGGTAFWSSSSRDGSWKWFRLIESARTSVRRTYGMGGTIPVRCKKFE